MRRASSVRTRHRRHRYRLRLAPRRAACPARRSGLARDPRDWRRSIRTIARDVGTLLGCELSPCKERSFSSLHGSRAPVGRELRLGELNADRQIDLPKGEVSRLRRHQYSRPPAEVTDPSDARAEWTSLAAAVGVVALLLEVFKSEQSGLRRSRKKGRAKYRAAESGRKCPEGH